MIRRMMISSAMVAAGLTSTFAAAPHVAHAAVTPVVRHAIVEGYALDDTLLGRSGKLRARFLPATLAREFARALEVMRVSSPEGGMRARIASLQILPLIPFQLKVAGRMGMYRMGFWPGEKRASRSVAYEDRKSVV